MKTRILSGIVLVIIMASALVCGSWYLFGLNLMIALIGMFELYRVIHMEKTVMAYAGYIACILYYICIGAGRDEYLLLVLAAAVMVESGETYRNGNVIVRGKNPRARGKAGDNLYIVRDDGDGDIVEIGAFRVDGIKILPDVYYDAKGRRINEKK